MIRTITSVGLLGFSGTLLSFAMHLKPNRSSTFFIPSSSGRYIPSDLAFWTSTGETDMGKSRRVCYESNGLYLLIDILLLSVGTLYQDESSEYLGVLSSCAGRSLNRISERAHCPNASKSYGN